MEPDFYLYSGDGNQEVLGTVRACFKLKTITSRDHRTVWLVKIDPSVHENALHRAARTDILGLSNRTTIPIDENLAKDGIAGVVVHDVDAMCDDILSDIGLGFLFKERPALRPDGSVVWPGRRASV